MSELREQLIDAGVIVPDFDEYELPGEARGLRLDELGRRAALREIEALRGRLPAEQPTTAPWCSR